jgi:hypothetical protein
MIESVKVVPAPAGAAGVYFECERLRATLSTQACADRWNAAVSGTTCCGCHIGREHNLRTSPGAAMGPKVRAPSRECLRCGRTDLRLIKRDGVCVSCFNRQREWHIGQNSKGDPPAHFEPLSTFTVATETPAGDVVHHAVEARHAAEAVGVAAMRLTSGSRLSAERPGPSAWSTKHRRLVVACPTCGHAGLLERESRSTLRHHCPACRGAPDGPGWGLARPRAATTMWPASTLVTWLRMTGEQPPPRWSATGFGCATCGTGVLQAQTTAAGQIEARCPACGDHHAEAAQ